MSRCGTPKRVLAPIALPMNSLRRPASAHPQRQQPQPTACRLLHRRAHGGAWAAAQGTPPKGH
eukprot:11458808-Alexandrium_andersonii.AAC.1